MSHRFISLAAAVMTAVVTTAAQIIPIAGTTDSLSFGEPDSIDVLLPDQYIEDEPDTLSQYFVQPLSQTMFLPAVYRGFIYMPEEDPFKPQTDGNPLNRWYDAAKARQAMENRIYQNFVLRYPYLVKYNLATLPVPPKKYVATVDPKKHTIEIHEVLPDAPDKLHADVEKRHWLRTFNAGLQFSQAYISPNWYQGGNNNLNMLVNLYYNVKLNQAYHPNLLFESTFQYKLGLNNAPDDSLRNYAISEDLLQINTTFGYKAARRWYYSVTAQFKTQILNSYVKNTHDLSSAFLSPAEFNAGLGMTYNFVNPKKTFSFDASISPLSYNMKICTKPDSVISHESFNIRPHRKYNFNLGSTAECKIQWQITSNIQLRSRLFVFTDYSYIQGDWENTLSMDINRYLSTQIYAHLRYDSTTPRTDNPNWHKLQIKEVLSFGVSYKFSSI